MDGKAAGAFLVYTDGASRGNPGPAAIGYAIFDDAGNLLEKDARTIGMHTNNEAEYEAVLWALSRATERGCAKVRLFLDSELVARQMNGQYRSRNARMASYLSRVRASVGLFQSFEVRNLPREHPRIRLVDSLVNEALDAR